MSVRLALRGLDRFAGRIDSALRSGGPAHPIRRALKQWGFIYRSYVRERYVTYSRGGGDWQDLAPSTKRRRRKGRKGGGGTYSILYDTGTLIAGLDPSFSPDKGAIETDIPFGIRLGYGGAARHKRGKGTIAMIAAAHDEGVPPHLPKRQIIVEPDDRAMRKIVEVTERALAQAWRRDAS